MDVEQVEYLGFNCLHLSNGLLSIWLTQEVGLRVIGLAMDGGENLLAHLPEASIEVADGSDYLLRGGHRLWYGPEVPQVTYLPDNHPVRTELGGGIVAQYQPADDPTGVEKAWSIKLEPTSPSLTIDHQLTNRGNEPITLAPWAITMLKPGGLGILPHQVELSDPNGLQPNRQLVLWPYTPIQSEFIQLHDEAVFVKATMEEDALKIGIPNPVGWLAYLFEDQVFAKFSDFDPEAVYIDRGASSQLYCNPDVIELETLGPEVTLQPGDSVKHREIWELSSFEDCRQEIRSLIEEYSDGAR